MEKIYIELAEILEVNPEVIKKESNFREDFEDWDSMKGFAIICLLEDEYSVSLSVDKFLECKTVNDLIELVSK